MPTLTIGRTATTTIIVGWDGYFGASVRDAVTGKPIDRATVRLASATGTGPYGVTDEQGIAFPGPAAIYSPGTFSPMNPARPRFESARICVTASGYAPACFGSDSADIKSAPLVPGRPGMQTIVAFALTPN